MKTTVTTTKKIQKIPPPVRTYLNAEAGFSGMRNLGGLEREERAINGMGKEGFKAECDWKIAKTRTFEEDRSRKEEQMIQTIEGNPTRVCIDSGAGESVCPIDSFPDYPTYKTSKVGSTYQAAGGQKLENVGEKQPHFTTHGIKSSMTFQATTKVQKPLAAASRITAKGNRIVLDDASSESYIENKATGARVPLEIINGVYTMEMEVSKPAAPFQRQAQK